jgi:Raf kinase inhibitor-like YbhB/YbcL family protein
MRKHNVWLTRLTLLTLLIFALLPMSGAFMNPEEKFTLSSPSFKDGGTMPSDFGCLGRDVSPALRWENPPAGTKTFSIILEDANGPWKHWIIFDIPASYTSLPENIPNVAVWNDGIKQGKSMSGRYGYQGPCPRGEGEFYFTITALDGNGKAIKKAVLNVASDG